MDDAPAIPRRQLGDTDLLRNRYERDDPMTREETEELRNNVSADTWRKLQMDRMARNTENQTGISAVPIGQGRTDAQIAAEYRERSLEVLGKLMDLINEARAEHGMNIIFQISGPDGFNRQSLALLEISKKLC